MQLLAMTSNQLTAVSWSCGLFTSFTRQECTGFLKGGGGREVEGRGLRACIWDIGNLFEGSVGWRCYLMELVGEKRFW